MCNCETDKITNELIEQCVAQAVPAGDGEAKSITSILLSVPTFITSILKVAYEVGKGVQVFITILEAILNILSVGGSVATKEKVKGILAKYLREG
jgi:hypothetical protein